MLTLPREVELCVRAQPTTGDVLWFLLNYASTARQVVVHDSYCDALTGEEVSGHVTMEPYGVVVRHAPVQRDGAEGQ